MRKHRDGDGSYLRQDNGKRSCALPGGSGEGAALGQSSVGSNGLFGVVVLVFGIGRTNQAEKAVALVPDAGGKEQMILSA